MVKLYLGYLVLIIMHELGHFILLKVFKVGVAQITIGNVFFFRIGKVRISPFVISGSTSFSDADFEKLAILPKVMVIVAGPIANFLSGVLISSTSVILSSIAFIMASLSLIPMPYLNTDGWCITKELYKRFFRDPKGEKG